MIKYINGDATYPIGNDKKLIVHIVNDIGKWGSGFVLAVSKRWTEPESNYRMFWKNFTLGENQYIQVEKDIMIVNMFAQHGIRSKSNIHPLDYAALAECLVSLNEYANKTNCSIHMPKIGAGLGGGDWRIIEKTIEDIIEKECYVYIF